MREKFAKPGFILACLQALLAPSVPTSAPRGDFFRQRDGNMNVAARHSWSRSGHCGWAIRSERSASGRSQVRRGIGKQPSMVLGAGLAIHGQA